MGLYIQEENNNKTLDSFYDFLRAEGHLLPNEDSISNRCIDFYQLCMN